MASEATSETLHVAIVEQGGSLSVVDDVGGYRHVLIGSEGGLPLSVDGAPPPSDNGDIDDAASVSATNDGAAVSPATITTTTTVKNDLPSAPVDPPPPGSSTKNESRTVWSCERCNKSLASAWKYARHLRAHTGEKPFECPVCSHRFSQKSDCQRHERAHYAKTRLYECSVCHKTLGSSSSLTKHMTTHTGERKFPCTKCPKSFPARGDLTKHFRIHTGEKPYQCDLCDRSFAESSTRNKHKLTHLTNKAFRCTVCPASFTRATCLKRHEEKNGHSPAPGILQASEAGEWEQASQTIEVPVYGIEDIKSGRVALAEGEVLLEAILNDTGEMTYVAVSQTQADAMMAGSETVTEALSVNELDENVTIQILVDELNEGDDTVVAEESTTDDVVNAESSVPECITYLEPSQKLQDDCQTPALPSNNKIFAEPLSITTESFQDPAEENDEVSNDSDVLQIDKPASSQSSQSCNDLTAYVFSTGKSEVRAQVMQGNNSFYNSISESNEFMCSKCDKIFVNSDVLSEHIAEHFSVDGKRAGRRVTGKNSSEEVRKGKEVVKNFTCDICCSKFSSQSRLKAHSRTHSNARPYPCSQCKKRYKSEGDLVRHHRTHVGDGKRYKCTVCDAALSSTSALKKHLHIHTGVRDFQCEICPKSFYAKGDLDKHRRIHTGDRPYKCLLCPKSFAESSTRNAHQQIHWCVKPFQCSVCEKRFTRRGDLNRHTKLHTGELNHKCSQCDASFPDPSALISHKVDVLDSKTGKLTCIKSRSAVPTAWRSSAVYAGQNV